MTSILDGWVNGGLPVEIIPFAHGYENGTYHCWAFVSSKGRDTYGPCRRRAAGRAIWCAGVHLCAQHLKQFERSGQHIVRLGRPLLLKLLSDLNEEAE